jgi:hypothetical protein
MEGSTVNKEPPVRFELWVPWREREQIKNAHLPGVYLLAHWTGAPPREVDPLAQEIIYIGETTEGSLLGRWQQFHRAAFEGKPGHTGGLRYRDIFGDEGEELYVAAFVPEGLSREMRALFIRHVEARLVWEWARKWDGAPLCNVKG